VTILFRVHKFCNTSGTLKHLSRKHNRDLSDQANCTGDINSNKKRRNFRSETPSTGASDLETRNLNATRISLAGPRANDRPITRPFASAAAAGSGKGMAESWPIWARAPWVLSSKGSTTSLNSTFSLSDRKSERRLTRFRSRFLPTRMASAETVDESASNGFHPDAESSSPAEAAPTIAPPVANDPPVPPTQPGAFAVAPAVAKAFDDVLHSDVRREHALAPEHANNSRSAFRRCSIGSSRA
jgi:hypothetical protein